MAVVKAHEVDRRLAEASRLPPVVLVYGPDHGLASERAADLVKRASADGDPFGVVRLDGDSLSSDPGRLSDEARTVALFGGPRIVWVRDAGTRNLLPAVEPLLDDPPTDAFIVIEAGNLKPTSPLRKAVEKHDAALAVPCYADGVRDIDRLLADEAARYELTVTDEAREALHALLGADRASTRSEIAKLCLYAHGDGAVRLDHIVAVVGDSSALSIEEAVDAAFLGDGAAAVRRLKRLDSAGTHPSVTAGSALRLAQMLHRMRAQVDQGMSADTVVDAAQPRIFFRRKPTIKTMLRSWSSGHLVRAQHRLSETVLGTRKTPHLALDLVTDTLLALAQSARRSR
ncbi:DNA polymerase III subunit delta [Amorphus sp. 3PC139-8]|uniref:DNA polymerase III subunit delta n=1 Tax=Amorphus sp. 3PC139-8 TaxID=2735676 RepID=UPI00345D43E9